MEVRDNVVVNVELNGSLDLLISLLAIEVVFVKEIKVLRIHRIELKG
jgi:hypothetical protein